MSDYLDTPQGPTNRHRLIIRHSSRDGIIALDRGTLPRIDTEDRHTADVAHLIDAIAVRYGIRTTVLRSVLHGDVVDGVVERVHELEIHRDAATSAQVAQTGGLVWARADSFTPL